MSLHSLNLSQPLVSRRRSGYTILHFPTRSIRYFSWAGGPSHSYYEPDKPSELYSSGSQPINFTAHNFMATSYHLDHL